MLSDAWCAESSQYWSICRCSKYTLLVLIALGMAGVVIAWQCMHVISVTQGMAARFVHTARGHHRHGADWIGLCVPSAVLEAHNAECQQEIGVLLILALINSCEAMQGYTGAFSCLLEVNQIVWH